MTRSAGRPKGEIETEMLAVRIPVDLGQQLNRYLDRLETRTGMKSNRASIARYALKVFLEAEERVQIQTRQEPQQSSQPIPSEQTPLQPRGRVLLPIGHSTLRGRIVTLLQKYPDGLTPTQVTKFLQLDKPARDTMRGMEQQGILKRVGTGLYAVDDVWSKTFPDF